MHISFFYAFASPSPHTNSFAIFKKRQKNDAPPPSSPHKSPQNETNNTPQKMDRCDAGVLAENDTDTVVKKDGRKKDRKTATLISPPAPSTPLSLSVVLTIIIPYKIYAK